VNDLTIGLLGALLATNQPLAVSNVLQEQTGITVPVVADPTERELHDIMAHDDLAHDEVSSWMATNTIPRTNLMAQAEFNRRIVARFDVVRQEYDRFLRNHPQHARGYLAYGSFLNDIGDEEGAKVQYENSKQLDPKNPAVWNNLANYYGEFSPVTNAFVDYAEAIRLDPTEPVYYRNFATTVYLFRKDAREFYNLTEPQVFDKALDLYRQAMKLAPTDFTLSTDYAESYYGIRPLRTNDALVAWTNALNIATTEAERAGVQIHLARVKISAGFYDEARAHLASVTNIEYAILKSRLEKSLLEHQFPDTNTVSATNLPAADTNVPVAPVPTPKLPDRRVLLDGH